MNLGNLAPLGIALLGLFMGMRHATDPDHVIAVTTILSRERRFGAATRIGDDLGSRAYHDRPCCRHCDNSV